MKTACYKSLFDTREKLFIMSTNKSYCVQDIKKKQYYTLTSCYLLLQLFFNRKNIIQILILFRKSIALSKAKEMVEISMRVAILFYPSRDCRGDLDGVED